MLFTNVKGRKWYQLIDQRAFTLAYNIDVFGNYQYARFWELIFSKGGYSFGRFGETISSALGKKQLEKSLSMGGWVIVVILFIIDVPKWFQRGHCIASIQTDAEINNFIK
jgi:hypothetical protein